MRTLIADTLKAIGQEVTIKGWVNTLRAHGQLNFADIRDRSGVIQVVGDQKIKELKSEYVVEITGKIKDRHPRYFNPRMITGKIELAVTAVKIIAKSRDLPFDLQSPDLKVTLPVLLDYRAASLRHQKIREIFKVQSTIAQAFRQYLVDHHFVEIFVPTIVSTSTEGGSQLFSLDYFDQKAYLAQSPQLYKQILTSIYERVFTLAHAYRAEPSVTTRHLTEYVGLDVELAFIDSWQDLIALADQIIKFIFGQVKSHHQSVLDEYGVTIPKTVDKTPQIKLKDALELVYRRTARDVRQETDLDPQAEKEICQWALENFGSDIIFVTHFYTQKRAWYSYPDPDNPTETLTFDLIGRGVEWISGGQRIHDYDQIVSRIKEKGMNPADFEAYLQCFRYGMPPEGGFCIGLERLTQHLLGLENLRQASLYPRDLERIDSRLAIKSQQP
jgi:nondiscriminating aspartyl-tRNA synthetase